jgi:alkylhydroperoxidase family enzyme
VILLDYDAHHRAQLPWIGMARIPLIDEAGHPELADVIACIKSKRRGRLINVYRLLLNSPRLAESWFIHNNAVRFDADLSGRLREMVIVRIGYLTRADYIVRQHVPGLAVPEGLTAAECEALRDWEASPFFDAGERAALRYADVMTQDIRVPDAVFAGLKPYFGNRQILDLTILIGTYNMHARVFQALEIDPEPITA